MLFPILMALFYSNIFGDNAAAPVDQTDSIKPGDRVGRLFVVR